MKKFIVILVNVLMVLSLLGGCSYLDNGQGVSDFGDISYEDISDDIIRFHVIANSDTEEDQKLKLKVRDRVVKYVAEELKDTKSIEIARKAILDNKEEIEKIAREVIVENGYNYEVDSMLSVENFPDKYYGDMLFPQGEYEAFRILIGDAKGQNWWCVMFPPLCFVDETTSAINSKDTKENFDDVLIEKNNPKQKGEKFKFSFKFLEVLKGD